MRALLCIACILGATPVLGRGPEQITTDWAGFQQQASTRKVAGHKVEITLIGGMKFKTKLISVSDQVLVVKSTSATTQWASRQKEADIPKDQIRAVRVDGRIGHRGLIGGLVGFGAGAAIAAAVVAGNGTACSESGCLVAAAPFIAAAAAVAGYFIGRATSPPGPEFILTP